MNDVISKKTGGESTIKVRTHGQLGGEKGTIEQVKIGALDRVRINVAPMNNIGLALAVHEEAGQVAGRRQGHEASRPAV